MDDKELHDRLQMDVDAYDEISNTFSESEYHYSLAEIVARELQEHIPQLLSDYINAGRDPLTATRDLQFDLVTYAFQTAYELGRTGHKLYKCECDPQKN